MVWESAIGHALAALVLTSSDSPDTLGGMMGDGKDHGGADAGFVTAAEAARILGHRASASVTALWTNHSRRIGTPPFDKYVDRETGAVRYGRASVEAYAYRRPVDRDAVFDPARAELATPRPAKEWAYGDSSRANSPVLNLVRGE